MHIHYSILLIKSHVVQNEYPLTMPQLTFSKKEIISIMFDFFSVFVYQKYSFILLTKMGS